MKKEEFIEYVFDSNGIRLTDDQFSGKEKIEGNLWLNRLTSIPKGFEIPEGFNPYVGGGLFLNSLTSIPKGFNPKVGGSLTLNSLTSIPKEFNPMVNGDLYLDSLTSIPEGFNPVVGGNLYLDSLTEIPENFNPEVKGKIFIDEETGYDKKPILEFMNFHI